MAEPGRIEVLASRSFPVAVERVFSAWLDPVEAAKFLFSTPEGEIVRCEIDPVPGGEFIIVDRREGEDIEHYGEYVEIAEGERIVFDFSVNGSPASRVSVHFARKGAACEVTLRHELDGQWAPFAERARQGWLNILDRLADELAQS